MTEPTAKRIFAGATVFAASLVALSFHLAASARLDHNLATELGFQTGSPYIPDRELRLIRFSIPDG